MTDSITKINHYLVKVFDTVLDIEETALQKSQFSDLSIKEMHTIDAIGYDDELTSTEVANKLNITIGTLTVAVNNLAKKGYVVRLKKDSDRRIVRLGLTDKGKLLHRLHTRFHRKMVIETIQGLNDEEVTVLTKGLENLYHFLQKTVEEQKK